MDNTILIENILKQLDIPVGKPYSNWINTQFCSILNGINIYLDTLEEAKENLIKIRRDFKRELEAAEKFNLDNLKQKSADFSREYEMIIKNFEEDLKSNKNQENIQNELKLNLKCFYEKLFVKTCLFTVDKSSKAEVNNFKLVFLHLGLDNIDVHFRNVIKFLLKKLAFTLPDKSYLINLNENSFLIKIMKLKIQNDKDLAFLSDEKWKNDQFLLALTQNKPDLKQFNLDLSFQVKLEKFLAQISQWLTQAAFARSNLPPEEISMVANSINTDSFFSGFYDTDILHLFFLPIQTLKEDFFSKFKNLRSLDLTETKLEELPSTIFQSLIYLIKLKIGKSAKRVNKDITQQSLLELQPFLFEFLVSLTSLDLISVKSISHKTFTGLTKLDSLSLDTVLGIDMDNPFRNLRNLKTLSINDTLLIVNEKIFQSLSCLRTLTLSFNPLANYEEETLIEPNAFAKLTSLMTLNFEFHNIPIITQEMFSSLNKLKNLSLKNNKIEAIEFYSFCDLLSLETLDLSENKIERITSDMFYGLINIKKLILKKNCLEYIEQGLFDLNMSRLIELNLSSNNLISIEKDIFAELPNLKFLSLGNNQIETIEANSFDRLTSLDTLLLNGNRLNNLSNEIFKGLENSLKYLNLAQNALSVIRSDSFSTLKCLEFIALTENRIESFDTNLFTGLDNLKKIDVDSNQFGYDKTWADLMFNTSKSLETIIIESRYIKKPITSLQKYAE